MSGALIEAPMPPLLPQTRYFEIDSQIAGARYAVWVSVPLTYASEPERRYPAIYLPDGNLSVLRTQSIPYDPIAPLTPFVTVCVGYAGEEAARLLAVRARDLLPPGEPLPDLYGDDFMDTVIGTGLLDRAGADLYLNYLRNPAADRFLAFLQQELHPLIVERFRIEPDRASLFGYSYGGLFATYAALAGNGLFDRIGAGSSGILPRRSKVFSLYEASRAAGTDFSGRTLYMTVCEREITAPTEYATLVGEGTVEFFALAARAPLRGLRFVTKIVEHETHASGFGPSWFGFLRTCFAAERPA